MNSKLRNIAGLIAALASVNFVTGAQESQSPFDSEILGQCVRDKSEAKIRVRGSAQIDDEDITSHAAGLSTNSEWIVDRTPGANFAWYLLEQTAGKACFTLFIPLAADVRLNRIGSQTVVTAQTQASPGGASYEMRFRRSANLGRYVPVQCFKISRSEKKSLDSRQVIDCLKVGD